MSSRLNGRMVRLEAQHGVRDYEGIDPNTLTDAELIDCIYRLEPGLAERWPTWSDMTTRERVNAFLHDQDTGLIAVGEAT